MNSGLSQEGHAIDIVQIIQELESISTTATRVPGLRNRVMVDSERMAKVAEELQSSIPSDILEAREVLKQKDSIINQTHLEVRRIKETAEQEAQALRAAAQQEQQAKIDETEVLKAAEAKSEDVNQQALQEAQQTIQDAQRRAYRIVEETESAALSRRAGSDQYARETLFDLEERLAELIGQVRRGIDALGLEAEEVKIAS